jgi:hypothetical protein
MKRPVLVLAALALGATLGCGKKAEQASTTSSDSLLATNPVEQPQGNLTPSTQYQTQQPPAEKPPAPAPKSAPRSAPKHTKTSTPTTHAEPENPGVILPSGTGVNVTIDAAINSETAHAGDPWTGVVKDPVVIGTSAPIPAGSIVHGVVEAAKPAEKGDRAMLLLAMESVTVNGKTHMLSAVGDSVVAGSTRARNVGAVAGGAAAGALIGHAIGGGKGALIGGLLGGGAATVGVAKSKGYQVEIAKGSDVTFHVTHEVAIKD